MSDVRLDLRFALLSAVLAFLAVALASLSACSPGVTQSTDPGEISALGSCEDREQASGAQYRICMPDPMPWNGDLLVYAHGYVAYNEPVEIPEDQLVIGDVSLPDIVTSLGYAFATTSYYTNGLAVREGIADLVDLVHIFTATYGIPAHTYLGGASEGGLITALAIEEYPDVFDGGLAACGPIGGLRKQVDQFGDFRVVFDYYFPDLLPGEPITIPQSLIDGWDTYYATVVSPTIADPASAYSLTQVLTVTAAAYDPGDPATTISTTRGVLWYNVFATNDAKAKLGGQPFDNQTRVYAGSDDDASLNDGVQRFSADQGALDEMEAHYQPTGQLSRPLVTLHTTLDEIIPYWHQALYYERVVANNRTPWYEGITVSRYGHCNFEPGEVVQAFMQLIDMVTNPSPDLSTSRKSVVDASGDGMAQAGEILTYTIAITNSGIYRAGIVLTDALPSGLAYVADSLSYDFPGTGFTATVSANVLMAHTQGYFSPAEDSALQPAEVATIVFAAQVSDPLPPGAHIANRIELQDQNQTYAIPPASIHTRYQILLPLILKQH